VRIVNSPVCARSPDFMRIPARCESRRSVGDDFPATLLR
jgi:hypothetical protein